MFSRVLFRLELFSKIKKKYLMVNFRIFIIFSTFSKITQKLKTFSLSQNISFESTPKGLQNTYTQFISISRSFHRQLNQTSLQSSMCVPCSAPGSKHRSSVQSSDAVLYREATAFPAAGQKTSTAPPVKCQATRHFKGKPSCAFRVMRREASTAPV